MRPETRVIARIDKLMDGLSREAQRSVAFHVHRTYGGAMTATERSQRFRSIHGNGKRNETVALPRNETVASPSSSTTSFLRYYSEQFEKAFNEKPNVNYAKDGAISKKLLAQYGEEKLQGLLLEFFASQDDFILKTGYTIGVFSSVLNKLLTAKTNTKRTLSAREIWAQAQQDKEAGR